MKTAGAQLAPPIRLAIRFGEHRWQKSFSKPFIVIGRAGNAGKPDLDLSLDINISRRQARIWREDGDCWLEDLGSKFGTKINGCRLEANARQKLAAGDLIKMGDTEMQVEIPETSAADSPLAKERPLPETVSISKSLDATGDTLKPPVPRDKSNSDHSRPFLDLVLELNNQTELTRLLPAILNQTVDLIPGAKRGALLLCSPDRKTLMLAAFVSDDEPAVSETLARRALAEKKGFIWRQNSQGDPGLSIQRHHIASGMYAPLICRGEALGVICVDSPSRDSVFSEDDLRLLLAVAHFAATAVANHQLQESLRENAKLLERLLTNFSPKLRATLLEKARHGRLRPGGEKSEVTILFSDIRDFTTKSAGMDPADVVEMLNDYLPALGHAIFQFDGTIDKFVGDAVLAVFGSPEPDARQHEKAVRAALAMQSAIAGVSAKRAAKGEAVCEIGIGIHCGKVLHGFIGSADRLEFTVIGDAVNRAARFCNQAKAGEILISYELYQRVFAQIESEKTSIVTKHSEKIPAYRVKSIQN
jgi:adenylate cyclase